MHLDRAAVAQQPYDRRRCLPRTICRLPAPRVCQARLRPAGELELDADLAQPVVG